MSAHYHPLLVALSVVIAILASFAALGFASRARRGWWIAGGATVMGLGIWSMHFVGMLAFQLPVPISYGTALLTLSVAVAIGASLLALLIMSRGTSSWSALAGGGTLLGAAIAGMHYIGMASMIVPARMTYDPAFVTASLLIAVGASVAALWLSFRLREEGATWRKPAAAVVMGVAIAGMHYTAMAGVSFAPGTMAMPSGAEVLATEQLGQTIAGVALIMMLIAIAGIMVDRRLLAERIRLLELVGQQAERLAEQAVQLTEQMRTAEAAVDQQRILNNELEAALIEAERARDAEREASDLRGRFVNMVSHELRTPLGAIGGYVQLLLLGIRGPISAEVTRDLDRIQVNQQHLLRLINELLELARLEAGQLPLTLSPVGLPEILDAAAPMIEPQLSAKNITYVCELPRDMPQVVGNAERVQQILINLLANSINFTPSAGRIEVTVARADGVMHLRVHDSGPGIPSDKAASVFTAFTQAGEPTYGAGGTGLGLTISRQLARAMGGELDVDMASSMGATFVLSLKCAAENAPFSGH